MLCKWSNGNIHYPLLSECFGSRNYGVIPIADDVIRLDMKITDDESLLAMISNSKERFAFVNDIYDEELEIENVMNEYNKKILKDHNCSKIICWGAGAYFRKNYKLIKKAMPVVHGHSFLSIVMLQINELSAPQTMQSHIAIAPLPQPICRQVLSLWLQLLRHMECTTVRTPIGRQR